uniref:Leucine-rich repeat receptor-like tyrosine-protein kinase n=1 Tax=Noccaea caerulescens TaxID=107243 RepID=A0A1J3I0B0_NOCCA
MKKTHVPSETGKSIIFCFSFIFLSCFHVHVCFSELSSNQTNTMIELSRLLNISYWKLPGSERNPCLWKGVRCSQPDNGSVISLTLSGFDLTNSSFLPLLCQIQTLESLDVSNNSLSSIPDGFMTTNCETLLALKHLNFSMNQVSSSSPGLRYFSKLEDLDFSYNRLSGNIGDYGLDGLVQLKTLNLNFNKLTGSVPTNLSKNLYKLEITDNSLSGSVPDSIQDYQELKLLDLSDNQLQGSIPTSLGNLSKLETLLLSNNHLLGPIPVSLSRIQTLRRFAANRNQFTGEIPSTITKHIKNLDLSYNNLKGMITGDLLSPQLSLVSVDLSFNRFHGWLPQSVSPSLMRLRLGSNKLTGPVPSSAFESLQNLTYLEMENNSFSGSIPPELASCPSLNLLNLAMNKFTGIIPPAFGNLTSLRVMQLQENKLTGEIPDEIKLLNNLLNLDLSWNSLSGSIPSSLSNLTKLSTMNLQGNHLSGTIPSNIGNLDSLIELQLGQNMLRGKIPVMPRKLQISLNLSYNMFEGPIPASLSVLDRLEVLDLSNNNFSGEIPDSLTRLISLSELILSNNQLTGNIPSFTKNVKLNVSGNPRIKKMNEEKIPNKKSSQGKSKQVLLVTFGVFALVVVIITVTALRFSRRFDGVNKMQVDPVGEERSIELPEVIHGKLFTSNALHRSNINIAKAVEAVARQENALFQKMFWSYYRVVMPSGSSYLVKKLKTRDRIVQQESSKQQLEQDLEKLGKLHHPNVMVPLAYTLYSEGCLLFYEFAHTRSTLYDVLHNHPGDVLDWTSRYSIALGIAQGISYLHGSISNGRDPILLQDLSSKKIMLKSLTEPLVGDIELFNVTDPSKSNSSLAAFAGTIGYIPPEYAYTMRVTMAGNVYSFGVILLELLTGRPAVSEGRELAKWVMQRHSSQQEQCNNIFDLRVSKTATKQMLRVLSVALVCINISPGARPKMKTVLRMLTRVSK